MPDLSGFQDNLDDDAPIRMSWTVRLLLLAAAGGGMYYCHSINDYVSLATIAIVYIVAMTGFRTGFTGKVASLVGLGAAIMYAPQLGMTQEYRVTEWFGTTGLLSRITAIAIAGVIISLVVTIVLNLVAGRAMRSSPGLARTNAWLGLGAGAVQGAAAVLLFLGGLLIIEPTQLNIANERASEVIASVTGKDASDIKIFSNPLTTVTDATRNSKLLGPIFEQYNPFVRIPQLNKIEEVQRTVKVLADPGQIKQLMDHPSITELQQQPQIQQAVRELKDDPELQRVLLSGKGIDRPTIMRLLNHPAVMELVDQPEFLEEAKRVIHEAAMKRQIEI